MAPRAALWSLLLIAAAGARRACAQGQTDAVGTLPGGGGGLGGGYLRGRGRGGYVRSPQCFEVTGANTYQCESVQTGGGSYQEQLQQGQIGGGARRQYVSAAVLQPTTGVARGVSASSSNSNNNAMVDWSKLSPQQQMRSAKDARLSVLDFESSEAYYDYFLAPETEGVELGLAFAPEPEARASV